VDASGFIPSFIGIEALRHFSETLHYILDTNEPRLHDLDWIVTWLKLLIAAINCEKALAGRNLFSDVAAAFPIRDVPFVKLDKTSSAICEISSLEIIYHQLLQKIGITCLDGHQWK
jgi:hypothetical protein